MRKRCANCIHYNVCDASRQPDTCKYYREENAVGKWISCTQELPIQGKKVLFCNTSGDIYYGFMISTVEWLEFHYGTSIYDVLAWMPLPEPYKKEEETETWNGFHGQLEVPKGTFDKIWNDEEGESE